MAYNQNTGGIGGLIGSALGGLFGSGDFTNPADPAMKYLNNIPGTISPYYNPYINRGNQAGDALQGQYGELLNDPGAKLNKIGTDYQKSPGFDFALQQALQGANHAAAAGGMAGTSQNQMEAMKAATGLANQDYENWLSHALGLYGTGIQGQQGMYNTGYNASNELAQNLANTMLNQAKLSYEGQNAENQHNSAQGSIWGDLLGGIGSLAGFLF